MDEDMEKIKQAFDLLEDAEVMQVFDDNIWISVDREAWEDFTGIKLNEDEGE